MNNAKIFVATLGCQMNENDTEVMRGVLARAGFGATDREDLADVLLINTCSVREFSEHKALSKLGEWGLRKAENPQLVVGVVGCMAQNRQAEILRRMPFVDIVCGPQHISRIGQMVRRVQEKRETLLEVEDTSDFSLRAVPIERSHPFKAYVTIMRGCDKTCTYCIVPKTRGREISRDPEEILEEIRGLADRGYKEVTLLGQNVNSYGKTLTPHPDPLPLKGRGELRDGGRVDFSALLHRVQDINGIERIRFVTSHPMDISDRMIEAIGDLPKICEYLHFPLQSGSDRILRRMKRYYTRSRYGELVEKIRAKKPGMALSTDIIVGFPGETQKDFQETVAALKEIQYDMAFLFKYSVRPGTPAEKLGDGIPKAVKGERHAILLDLQNQITLARSKAHIGKEVEILVEGPSQGNPERWAGRTRENKLALFPAGLAEPGQTIRLKVQDATASTLRCGELGGHITGPKLPRAELTTKR